MFHVKHTPHILLINPWITDFAAYNFWNRPLGLLYIASLLRKNSFRVTVIDCLDILTKKKEYRHGKFYKTRIAKPPLLRSIPRNYSRYGILEESLVERLFSTERPDLIGITSGMTYWYPGVLEIIEITRKFFKKVPIVLGGIYAALCYEHAKKHSDADVVFKGGDEWEALKLFAEFLGMEILTDELPYPAFDVYPQLDYVCIATSRGCPFRCTYCASPILSNGFVRRNPTGVAEEIEHWTTEYSVENIAFYDDALLLNAREHIVPIMKQLIRRGIRCNFHTPNGLHVKEVDWELADLLFRSRFKTIRLGFETSNEVTQIETGGKVDNQEFTNAVKHLRRAGYSANEIGVYIMVGLPGQRVGEVEESVGFVKRAGARPLLVEYSPVPHTPLFERAKQMSSFDLNEPLFQNNSILPCQWEGFTTADLRRLKERIKDETIGNC
jgi:radical SAM superfamily enzyme YgiQ (UPF0313 family)